MASADSAHYALQSPTRTRTGLQAPPNVSDGEVQYTFIPVTFAGTETALDTVNLCQLPAGVIPLPQLSNITVDDDPGTTLTVDIGPAANPDGCADGSDVASVGVVACCTAAIPAYAIAATPLDADSGAEDGLVTIVMTYATLGTPAAGHFVVCLAYKLPR